jgi:predicted nucleotidyltransferase
MDLTAVSRQTIIEWAERTKCITEVRLFGSRAKGCARPDSDVDLAVTIAADHTGDSFSIFVADRGDWEMELLRLTGLCVDVQLYDKDQGAKVYAYCQEASVLLYSRNA